MPEQIALLERNPTDALWIARLTADDPVVDLGSTFVVNGLVTPSNTAVTSLIAPAGIAEAGRRLAAVTVKVEDGIYLTPRSGNPAAPSFWSVPELGQAIGLNLTELPAEYEGWRFATEIYVLHGGAFYLVTGKIATRHRVLSGDEISMTFVQRLMPFLTARPDELTGVMLFLVVVPSRTAALGGLRGYRRALIDAGRASSALAGLATDDTIGWAWETEFYDDAAARILGVDGVERIPTHIGYQRLPRADESGVQES
jgi:hypothetical protein